MATTKTPTRKADESPRDRFVKLANARVSKAIGAVSLISNLAAPARYEYTDSDIDKIEQALSDAVQTAVQALRERKAPRGASFRIV